MASRRHALGILGAVVAAGPVLAACGSRAATASTAPAPSAVPAGADTIMLIRHAEKPTGSATPYGITEDGQHSDGSLTVRGWTRAGALVGLFAPPVGGQVRAGLVTPAVIYAAKPNGDASQRPSQTVTPLAARLSLKLNLSYGKGDEKALAAEITGLHGVTLVSWQHEEIPAIAANLGLVQPAPPAKWPDDRFDVVWVFTRTSTGWAFSQVPQLLLDGDRNEIIA